jgi:cellulose synthase (UDP-forming)
MSEKSAESALKELMKTDAADSGSSRQPSGSCFLVKLMSPRQYVEYVICVYVLLIVLASFWWWWLRPEHNIDTLTFLLSSVALAWVSLLPLYLIFIFGFSRTPAKNLPLPQNLRVAMVVTKAPSESFEIVRETLEAMLRQGYPHDTWLADEDPSQETINWCLERGVKLSTRKGHREYHRLEWPRRTRCKEGNLAFFYDHYGYDNYDFVVQLDADHVPEHGYLEEMLRPFLDPEVGYVSAPSICDGNALESWSARGRLYVEAGLHGALQAGYTAGLAPLCIGSHYAVRTSALREIGGLGPELAEDHSTSLIFNAHGWRGVHAIDALAHGRGPQTFGDLVAQEFQWSRSLVTILLRYTPRYFGSLPTKLKLQFGFCQLWYPLFSLTMLLMYCLPIFALLNDKNMVGVAYSEFFVRFSLVWVTLIFIAFRWRVHKFIRPVEANIFSWEGTLFLFARWPWTLLGSAAAIKDWLTGTTSDFRVTPKAYAAAPPLPFRLIAPYAFLSVASGLPVILLNGIEKARGFFIFATVNCTLYAILLLVIVIRHWKENPGSLAITRSQPVTKQVALGALITSVMAVPIIAVPLRVPQGVDALLWGQERLFNTSFTQAKLILPRAVTAGFTVPESKREEVKLGVYDPADAFREASAISVDHTFVQWQLSDAQQRVEVALRHAAQHNRRPMITVEPWTKAVNWIDGADRLFDEIVGGQYDQEISGVCGAIGTSKSQIWIRWGQEMEESTQRYPWARNDAEGYIRAFRYFVQKCRMLAPNALFMWSPKGENSLDRYYPGDDVVDVVGISVYGMEAWEIAYYGNPRSAIENVLEKYQRVSKYKKPVVIAEFGIYGDETYIHTWMAELSGKIWAFPLMRAIVYFNDKEPYNWGKKPYASADWRVGASVFFSSWCAPSLERVANGCR